MKLTKHIIALTVATAAIATYSCDDNVTTLGSSLITDETEIVIDSTFTLTGRSTTNDDVQSRTTMQILGNITAKEYGHFSAEFVTQFMPAYQLDTAGIHSVNDIDSIRLLMFFRPGEMTGDSIVPMGLKVYPLNRQLPSPIYSDFDPTGYYDEADCWTDKNQIYTGNALYNDSVNSLAYRTISVKLPIEFAHRFYNEYLTSPQTFATPQAFAQFFPGIYVKNTFGSGRVINFSETRINLSYQRHATIGSGDNERDTTYSTTKTYMAVTPEVITNNIIDMSLSPDLVNRINSGEALIVAPASYDVEITFPTREIINKYKAQAGDMSVINTLSLAIPAYKIPNTYNIEPPQYVLMVLKKDKKDFFAENQIPDDRTSFLGTYNSETESYDFAGLRPYIIEMLGKTSLTADDYTFTLTPVNVTTENSSSSSYYYSDTQSYITAIAPYVAGPAMCKLDIEKAKIKFTYSKQSIKN